MTKNKPLLALLLTLIISNLILLVLVIKKPNHDRPKHRQEGKMKTMIINKLELDEQQSIAYEALIKKHRYELSEAEKSIQTATQALFTTLKKDQSNEQLQDSLIHTISAAHAAINQAHVLHFQQLKDLCKPEQKGNFIALCDELQMNFGAHHPPK